MIKAIPDGYHTVTPCFTFKDSKQAIEFYKKAFGAELIDLMSNPNGQGTIHATLKIGNSIVMMGDEMPGDEKCSKSAETLGNSPISFYIYVENVDEIFKRATAAGGKMTMGVTDMFWGDRMGQISDPFGYSWMIATHNKDLTNEQIQKGAQEFFAKASEEENESTSVN